MRSANETNLIKIYTNKQILSERVDGELIEWKFNSPYIEIKLKDLQNKR